MQETILIALGTALSTGFAQWIFYRRKHKATAVGAEKQNDRVELDNYKLIAEEWRETAQRWKEMADKYQMELVEEKKYRAGMESQLAENLNKIACLESKLLQLEKQ